MKRTLLQLLPSLFLIPALLSAQEPDQNWRQLQPGLELGTFKLIHKGKVARYPVQILRIDPERYEFVLLNTSAPDQGQLHTAREWCRDNGFLAGINASMYQADYRRSVSLMRTADHVNNSHFSKDKAILAFDARDTTVPPVQIIDRTCQDFPEISVRYGTLVQSIRMVSCNRNNVWSQQKKRYSIAAIGIDTSGRVLLMHSRSPFSTHDLIEVLLELPIDLYNAMYVEGGPEAQLFVGAGGMDAEFVGSFETGFFESDLNRKAWPVPNIVAIRARADKHDADAREGE